MIPQFTDMMNPLALHNNQFLTPQNVQVIKPMGKSVNFYISYNKAVNENKSLRPIERNQSPLVRWLMPQPEQWNQEVIQEQ